MAPLLATLLLGCAGSAAVALWLAGLAAPVEREPGLTQLLRVMALVKTLMVAAAVALVCWRATHPVRPVLAGTYVAACWIGAGATLLVWHLAFVPAAAVAFHVAEAAFLLAAWLDAKHWRGRPVA